MPGKGFDAPYGYVELRGVSHEEDDRHVVETATNRIFQDHRGVLFNDIWRVEHVELRDVSHEEDDRHDVKTTPDRIFQDLYSVKKVSLTGTKGTCVLSVQKNFTVINQLGC